MSFCFRRCRLFHGTSVERKSRFIFFWVDVRGVAMGLVVLDLYVSAMGIDSSFICVRFSVASGTYFIVGPVGISVSCDIYYVVVVVVLRCNVVVACSVAVIGKLLIE
jgi:hypothetical protein